MDQGFPVLTSRRVFLALAGLLAPALPAAAQAVDYRPNGAGFRVLFPGKPRVARELVSTRYGNTHAVTALFERADGAKFYAQHTDYPPAAAQAGAGRLLDNLTVGRTVKGRLRAAQRFQFEGNPAQRETVQLNFATRPVMVALDVLRGLRLYSVFCFVDPGQEDTPEVQAFIDSFALLPL